MSCFSCMPPASQKPRKIYNILVPDVFPAKAPNPADPIPGSIKKKIVKLQEYCQKNPGNIAKVSRRLTRRMKQALYEQQLGYVKISVNAYIYLLDESANEESSYSLNFFTKELIHEPDAVIKTLISYPKPEVQALGADLLGSFIRAQTGVEMQAEAVKQLVKALVSTMLVKSQAAAGGTVRAPEAVKAAGMQCLREYVLFYQRVKSLPDLVEEVMECVLSNVDLSSEESKRMLQQVASSNAEISPAMVDVAVKAESAPAKQPTAADHALSVLRSFRPFLQDVGIVYRVLDVLLRYLDKEGRWDQTAFVEGLLSLVKHACGDQTYPFFASLMRHSSAPGLTPQQRTFVIKQALTKVTSYSLSAISLTLAELPKALAVAEQSPGTKPQEQQQLHQEAVAAVQQLALEVGDAAQLCEAVAGALKQYTASPEADLAWWHRPTLLAALECALAAVKAIPKFKNQGRHFPPKVFPSALLQQLGGVIIQQTHAIQPAALSARRLALRVVREMLVAVEPAGLADERHAQALLALVWSAAAGTEAGPQELESAAELAAVAAAMKRPAVLLQLARIVQALRTHYFEGAFASGPVRTCAHLLLVDCLLQQLSTCASCSGLQQLLTPGQSLQLGAGGLTLKDKQLHGSFQLPVLVAAAEASHGLFAEDSGKAGVEAARKVSGGPEEWAAAFPRAVCAEGLLAQEHGASLPGLLAQPLDASSPEKVSSLFNSALQPSQRLAQLASGTRTDPATTVSLRVDRAEVVHMTAGQAEQLSQRVEASWTVKGSFRREKVDLERVLEMLEENEESVGVLVGSGASGTTAAPKQQQQQVPEQPVASIQEVLDLVAGLGFGEQRGLATGAAMPLDLGKLVQHFDPVVA